LIDEKRPTLLIDEADTFLKPGSELQGVLNSGHNFGRSVRRAEKTKHGVSFSTFSALAISLIGNLPGTLADRSVKIQLRRRMKHETVASLRLDKIDETLAGKCARWALDNFQRLPADPMVPEGLFNRVADNWRPLLAIADAVGGIWPQSLREIAVRVAKDSEEQSQGEQRLQEILEIFAGREWVSSDELVRKLTGILNGKQLALRLKPYGIAPRQDRIQGQPQRGYWLRDFADAFARYLGVPLVPDVPVTEPLLKENTTPSSEGDPRTGTSGTSGTATKASIGGLTRRV
jgi:Protein of unknown function (DUF3631)